MAGNKIKTSRESLDSFVKHIKKFETAERNAIQLLKRDYTSLGADWDDIKYRQVGEILNGVEVKTKAIEPELERLIVSIRRLEAAVADYENSRVG